MARDAPTVADVWDTSLNETAILWLPTTAWFTAKWFLIEQLPHSEGKDYKTWMYPRQMRYVARPNERTQEWAHAFLRENLYRFKAASQTETAIYPQAPPSRAICVHIRQGDKAQEMALHSVSEYLAAAETYSRNLNVTDIFLTTESPSVLEEIMSAEMSARFPTFTYYYTNYPRVRDSIAPVKMAQRLGPSYLALVSLANLYLGAHPSCEAFVETTSSNWCALINDLRVTDGRRSEAWRLTDLEGSQY